MKFHAIRLAAILLAAAPTVAAADGPYAGLGVGYADMKSDSGFGETSNLEGAVVGLTAGYRWDLATAFAGAEIDLDIAPEADFDYFGFTCADGADGPYACSHDATVRLRGLYGTDIGTGGLEIFATLGIGMVFGSSAVDTNQQADFSAYGGTFSVGAQAPLGTGVLRGEIIRDQFEEIGTEPCDGSTCYSPGFEATTAKLTYLFSF